MRDKIKEFISTTQAAGKSPPKCLKTIEDYAAVKEFLNSTYGDIGTSKQLYLVQNDLSNVPLTACGKEVKFEGMRIRMCCNDYKGSDPESCPACYEFQRNLRNTNRVKSVQEKYGVRSVSQIPEVRRKAEESTFKKYGVTNISQRHETKEAKQKLYNKRKCSNEFLLEKSFPYLKNRYIKLEDFCSDNFDINYISAIRNEMISLTCKRCNTVCDIRNFHSNEASVRCPKCDHKTISTMELELREFVSSLTTEEVVYSDRTVLGGKEIDIYIPKLKIGIEFNGIYWHSHDSTYHQKKTIQAHEAGINLIHIYEDEWKFNTDRIKNRLQTLISKDQMKLSARKCTVQEIDKKVAKEFCDIHHMNSYAFGEIRIGLFYGSELVAVSVLNKSRYNPDYEYELIRFCSKYNVRGAFDKLLKYFERTYNPSSLMSYADYDWSCGAVYEKTGFKYKGCTKPGYFYSELSNSKYIRHSRYECQKHKLVQKYNFDPALTETQMTELLGYHKIYNSGNLIFYKIY